MATATLELVNPYSKYGLKRRPTYDEIANLIHENETLTGALPDRTAAQFKASQEGSFFDGLDNLEILKEEQNRIQERQLRELMLRRNLGGGTYHLERLRAQRRENTPPEPETPSSNGDMTDAQMQTELQRRATDYTNRMQQTGDAHQGILSRSASSVIDGIFNTLSPLSRGNFTPLIPPLSRASSRDIPPLEMPSPQRPRQREALQTATRKALPTATPQVIHIASDSEAEMMTARESVPEFTDTKQETIYYSLRASNPDASRGELAEAYNVLDKYRNKTSGALARNTREISEVYQTMMANGFISQPTFNEFLALVTRLNSARGQQNKEEVRNEMGRHYTENIYNRYVADIARRKGAQTKAMARKSRATSSTG